MENTTSEVKEVLAFIKNKTKMVAMIAPSFPIDFNYPEIVGMLKRLGFEYVVELSNGALETNRQMLALIKLHPDKRYITSPCPGITRLIKSQFPELVQFLARVDSPMSATTKICDKKYPGHRKIHIGPCFVKKLECVEGYPELKITSLTYKELAQLFEIRKIKPKKGDKKADFDIKGAETRLYPISGGLAQSAGITKMLTDEEYDVISGPALVTKVLKEFPLKTNLKILDILFCDGGCISGAGIISSDSIDVKRKKVSDFWEANK